MLREQYLRDRDTRWRKWFHESTFRGCAFINAVGELGDSKPDIYAVSKEHKDNIYQDVLQICLDSKINTPEKFAKQIMLLMEGAIIRAYLNEDKEVAIYTKEIALSILVKH